MQVRDVLPRDAIPSIDDPTFDGEYFGDGDDVVIVVEGASGTVRAYPVRILSYHEIVNDEIDGRPVAVTWCPICGSAVVFDRRADGRVLTFGTSGKLADDGLVMYDRETDSEWRQPSGEAIAGALDGRTLDVLSATVTTYERFAVDHPEGRVLRPVKGTGGPGDPSARKHYEMAPYEEYERATDFGLYAMRGEGERREWNRADFGPKTVVLGITREGEAVGYSLPRVRDAGGVVTDSVGGLDVVVFAAGDELHAFEGPGYDFERVDDSDGRAGERTGTDGSDQFRADGTNWDGVTGESADGRALNPVPARRLYAFAWQDDHGSDAFYGR
ncbi:DUF3179 domain-containing protein [Halosimplex salinum]|uniref:DUF3179 domain-containing protein n=1 Tax=Halosimplex salinum TaxID=1710538 RepID=UPI000F4940D8|nr:DUF3179 domain-containing protein [Halosimplex salinum]